MAELELSVRYNNRINRIGFFVMTMLFPVWALFVPFCLGLFIDLIIKTGDALAPHIALSVLLILAAIPILSIALTALFEDNRVYVTKGGISFPLYMLPFLGFRRQRSWVELLSADVRRTIGSKDLHPNQLVLFFEKCLPISLRLESFDKEQLEQLLLAIELWSGRSTRTLELVDYQNALQNENKGLGRLSQGKVWEEELARRFSATSFVPLEPGRELAQGSLKIVRQLAFGGLSAIYLAQHNGQKMVVLKEAIVPANADAQTRIKAQEHFMREAEILIELEHPHIAKVLAYLVDDGRDYMMLEYVPGPDLRQYVKQHGLQAESVVADWALKIADIIKYLHQQEPPIIHRDLTPDNLVLNKDGSLVLIDFGAANQFIGTATGTLVGKQAYIAPEQLRGKARTTSDIYAFGGTLYYLLTGKDPVPLSASRPLNDGVEISVELDDLIAGMTAFDAELRFADLPTIIDRLQEISVSAKRMTGDPALPRGVT